MNEGEDKMNENELPFGFIHWVVLPSGGALFVDTIPSTFKSREKRNYFLLQTIFTIEKCNRTQWNQMNTIVANGRTISHHPPVHISPSLCTFKREYIKISTTPRTITMCFKRINVRNLPSTQWEKKALRNGFSGEKFMYMCMKWRPIFCQMEFMRCLFLISPDSRREPSVYGAYTQLKMWHCWYRFFSQQVHGS